MSLQILMFGGLRISREGRSDVRLTGQMRDLFAYLLLQRNRSHSREALAAVFWGDQPDARARGSLNTALWRLRTTFDLTGMVNGGPLIVERDEVAFNTSGGYWLDVAEFEAKVERMLKLPADCIGSHESQQLEAGLALYRGDLLEGCYQEWALSERERLRTMYLSALELQMHCYARQGQVERGLACGQQILQMDSLRESVHREVMRLHLRNGQRALALRQFSICRATLAAELGVPPMRETVDLHAEIVAQDAAMQNQPTQRDNQRFAELLQTATEELHAARARVDHAMALINELRGL